MCCRIWKPVQTLPKTLKVEYTSVTNIPLSFGACRCAFVTNDPFDLTCQGLVLVDAPLSRGGTVGVNHTMASRRATVFCGGSP